MNNSDNDYTIRCSRCGEEIKSSARYCMKCGNLNSDHPENKNMIPYIKDNQEGYSIGEGKFIKNGNNSSKSNVTIGSNTGSKKVCFIFNMITYFAVVLITFLICFLSVGDIVKIINTPFPFLLSIYSITFLYCYSFELLFMKMNERWWASLIPLYNNLIFSRGLFKKTLLGILFFIPGVNFFFSIYALYVLAKKFKITPLFTILLTFIAIPYLGLSSRLFDDKNYVDGREQTLEKEYKFRKTFMSLMLFLFLIGILLGAYGNMDTVENILSNADSYIYVYASNSYVNKIKKGIEEEKITCEGQFDSNNGVYYFYTNELSSEVYVPLQTFRDELSAYVRVDIFDGDTKYYITITDGKKGFKETLIEDVTVDSIVSYSNLGYKYEDGNKCILN